MTFSRRVICSAIFDISFCREEDSLGWDGGLVVLTGVFLGAGVGIVVFLAAVE